MKTISQVAELTGISTRTLQYYDEIELFKPTKLTKSGYRLYDDEALQKLQQILFFKELGFSLKEIHEIIQKPDYDKLKAFKKQKELLLLKRNRIDNLVQLLERLEKGEQCMSFKEFDLSDYINALEGFKNNSTDDIIKHWGSIENFDLFIQKVKDDETEVAKLAIKQYGSIEKYTEAMKYNLEHFSEIAEKRITTDTEKLLQQSDALYKRLTSDMGKEVSSDYIQSIVKEIIDFTCKNASTVSLGKNFWNIIIDSYSNDYIKAITDTKYGAGASDYIVRALRHYCTNNSFEYN